MAQKCKHSDTEECAFACLDTRDQKIRCGLTFLQLSKKQQGLYPELHNKKPEVRLLPFCPQEFYFGKRKSEKRQFNKEVLEKYKRRI